MRTKIKQHKKIMRLYLKQKNNDFKTLEKFYDRRNIIKNISLRFLTSIITVLIAKKT